MEDRRADRRIIATLSVNKHLGYRYSHVQQVDPRLSLEAEELVAIRKVDVHQRDGLDQHIHVNVSDHNRRCGAS
ncbi:hypothetical protein PHSY_005789 [Pseudozyma hubeiensis SY62]|uniref:Uncharacterized protein n=1 Tax=Pseudozyma hubeiensis (strain SY62) TaxID=1305764 RepID=R9PJA4_PSEHS|nr:hypothetical protein PHSY_005789 [Pseudozyma hubeiensis SY62]GAC98200.1 hypothetical protein PHSY_005789 [Pseudozyma hubeiensis SY62]